MMKKQSYQKKERLKSRKDIDALFREGSSVHIFPIRAVFRTISQNGGPPVKAAVSVSSRLFRKSVDRNLIKRRIREAYRKQKDLVTLQEGKHIQLMLIYTANKELPFHNIFKAVGRILQQL